MSTLGTDIATPVSAEGLLDLDPAFALVSGRTQLAQACGRRITTLAGSLAWIGESNSYGIHVGNELGGEADGRAAFVIAAKVQDELLKDERVLGADVTATITDGVLTIVARLADAAGPFKLTLAVSAVGVDLLRVTQ